MLQSTGKGLLALLLIVPLVAVLVAGVSAMGAASAAVDDDAALAPAKDKKKKKGKKGKQAKQVEEAPPVDPEPVFAENAFPPTIPDTDWHQDAWLKDDCLRCHETGVRDAPMIEHEGMAPILLRAKCRSCHVLIPGSEPRKIEPQPSMFAENAFPPMIPASGSHREAWTRDDCLLCHDGGIMDAPEVQHEGMPALLLEVKCRSCHVQVRADEAAGPQ